MDKWREQQTSTRQDLDMSYDRVQELSKARDEVLPVITQESESGAKPFKRLVFQPVKSPGNYEAEFVVKNDDLVFHFWPSGFHEAERGGLALPRFNKDFETKLQQAMATSFDKPRLDISFDKEMGAWFVLAKSYGTSLFHRNLAISACEKLHNLLVADS